MAQSRMDRDDWSPVDPIELRFNNGRLEMRWHKDKDWGVREWRPIPSVTDGKPDDR
jgi:hypothetical protein